MSNSKGGRTVDPNSKASLAHGVYAQFAGQDVKSSVIVAAMIDQLGVSKGTAQVYLHNARKALGLTKIRADKGTADASTTDQATADIITSDPVAESAPADVVKNESEELAEVA